MKQLLLPINKIFCCSLVLVGLLLTVSHYVDATDGTSLWGPRADNPTVKVVEENHTASQEERHNCHDHDFVLRASNDYLHPFTPVYEDETFTQCAFYTAFGLLSTNGLMQLNSSIQPYHISDNLTISDVPNEKSLFVGYSTGGLAAFDNPLNIFEVGSGADYFSLFTTYENQYHLKSYDTRRILKDSKGNIVFQLSHIGSSDNAKWFIAQRYKQFIRVKADDFSNLLAMPATDEYDAWGSPKNDALAITDDGRYVAATGNDRPSFKLYDLSTCQADTNYNLNDATGCGSIDMLNYLQQQVKLPVVQVNFPHFSDDGTQLSLNVVVNDNGTKRNELVALLAPGASYDPPAQASNYVALGDSYASGEGAFNYFDGTDEGDNKCHLSKASYPYLLGLSLQLDSVHSVACSGARMVNVNGSGVEASQYTTKPLDAFSLDWLPGYIPQLQFIDQKQPSIITVSMVGNDVGFADIIKRCILFDDTCYSSYEDRLGLVENIDSKFDSLVAMYTQIKAAAAPNAKVYVIGYPSIVKPDGDCGLNVHLNNAETEFASKLTNYLDYVIKLATEKAGVTYVDTEDALGGFQLCDDASADISAVNGLTAGNDTLHLIGQESYHPTAFGHQLLADTIATLTDNMTEKNPAPDWAIEGPNLSQVEDFLNAPKTGKDIRKIVFDGLEPSLLLPGGSISGVLQAYEYNLDQKTSYSFLLHSTSIKLGTVLSDQDGNLNYSFSIPQGLEPGWHTLDILGNDITGQSIDIQRMIYVAASADDWDGDGIPNDHEPCGLFDASGVDVDKDGIDDACDGVISKPPVPVAPTVSITNPVNAANQQQAIVSGSGEGGTVAHISVDDTDPDTKAVTAEATLPASDASTVDYTQSLDVSSLDDGKLVVSVTLSNDNGTSPAATADSIKDTHPPQISIAQDPAANEAGWNNQVVELQLEASDTGTGVADLTYGATGAQPIDTQSTGSGSTSFTISTEGETIVTYTATDRAGNSAATQIKTVRIDTEPPTTQIDKPQGPVLFGIFGDVLTGTTVDNLSGAATTQVTFVSEGNRKITTTLQATCVIGCDTANTTWQISPTHLPSGLYTVTASSTGQASNSGPATTPLRIVIVNFPWLWW